MDIIEVHNNTNAENDLRQTIYDIKGAAFESFKFYREFVDEITYEIGVMMELGKRPEYTVHRQREFYVFYKGENTGITRRMDLVIDTPNGTFIVEMKALNAVDDKQRRQLWSYMKLINCQYGILVNCSPNGVYTEVWRMNLSTFNFKKI